MKEKAQFVKKPQKLISFVRWFGASEMRKSVGKLFQSHYERASTFYPKPNQIKSHSTKTFCRFVLQLKEGLEEVKQKLEKLDSGEKWINQQNIKTKELEIAKTVSTQLLRAHKPIFSEISILLQGKESSERIMTTEYFRSTLGNIFYQAPIANRAFVKPNGYSGDFEMLNCIYRNELLGDSLFAKCLNAYFLNHPFSMAVRNRVDLIKERINKKLEASDPKKSFKILSVVSGPAKEIIDLVRSGVSAHRELNVVFLDADNQALLYAQRSLAEAQRVSEARVQGSFYRSNIIEFVRQLHFEKYDFIYSAGLFDYLNDSLGNLIGKKLFQLLESGGELMVGNFSPYASGQMQLELILDWYLKYRNEESLWKVLSNISSKMEILREPAGLDLFAVLTKR